MEHMWENSYHSGIQTGLSGLDDLLVGLVPGQMTMIGARPGMGKAALALNIAVNAAKSAGKTVAFYSLDMSQEQLRTRMFSRETDIALIKLLNDDLTDDERRRIAEAAASLNALNIIIDDNPVTTVADMTAQCREIGNLGLVIIDYVQLLCSVHLSQREDYHRELSEISLNIKRMAKALNVPVICVSQLSSALEKRVDRRPVLNDFRDSALISDADVIVGLYYENYYYDDCEDPHAAEALVLKNRNGETGTVKLRVDFEHMAFASCEQ